MKHLFGSVAILAITMSTAALADQTRVKVYDQKGRYDGQIVQDGRTVRSYNQNGVPTGRDVLQSDGRTVYSYDAEGHLVRRYVIEGGKCPAGVTCR